MRKRWLYIFNKNNSEKKFIENIDQFPLSKVAYILWNHHRNEKNIEFSYKLKPTLNFIYRFENKYYLYGQNAWKQYRKIQWLKTNIVVMFEDSSFDDLIHSKFQNFRSLETNESSDVFNTYLTLRLTPNDFSFLEKEEINTIRLPKQNTDLPKRYKHLNGGINYGVLQGDEIISFAAAPYILIKQNYSFAIIRSVETKLLERKKGLGLQTVGKLIQYLFNQLEVKNIVLWVDEGNFGARRLYEKLGFKTESSFLATYCDCKF